MAITYNRIEVHFNLFITNSKNIGFKKNEKHKILGQSHLILQYCSFNEP